MPGQRPPDPAVVDASFWINAERCGLLPHLSPYFALKVTPGVARELSSTHRWRQRSSVEPLFEQWRAQGLVEIVVPQHLFAGFDAGENETIALAQERGWWLLIDDGDPRDYARGRLGLPVVDSPAFAVFLYDSGALDLALTLAALRRSRAAHRVVREAYDLLQAIAHQKGDLQ